MYRNGRVRKMKNSAKISVALFALAMALSPALALAHPMQNGGHEHTITIHDRSSKPHTHTSTAHH
jgi:hypothetical protein